MFTNSVPNFGKVFVESVQVYNLVSDILCKLFGVSHGSGEVGMQEMDSVDSLDLHT